MATHLLAELLGRRKELQAKVQVLVGLKDQKLYEVKTGRKAAHEGLDDIIVQVPLLHANQVTREYDWHAKKLRECDQLIQRTNWSTNVDQVPDDLFKDFDEVHPNKDIAREESGQLGNANVLATK